MTKQELLEELGIGLNDFRRIVENISLTNQVSNARHTEDFRDVLYTLIDMCLPCTSQEWIKVNNFINQDQL